MAAQGRAADFTVVDGQIAGPQSLLDENDTGVIQGGGIVFAGAAPGVRMLDDGQSLRNRGEIGATGDSAPGGSPG